MSPKQQLFVDEYMKDRNATQAYIRAGYSPKGASTHAARLVANGPVSTEIAKRVEEYSRIAGLSVVALLEQAKLIAFSDIRQLFDENGRLMDPTQWPEGVAAAVAGIDLVERGTSEDGKPVLVGRTAKVRLCDKPDALKTLLAFLRGA